MKGRAPLRAGRRSRRRLPDRQRANASRPRIDADSRPGRQRLVLLFLRDVGSENPIYIPAYGTIVLPGGDDRSYDEAENDILSRKNLTKIQRIEREPETSFASASARTRRSNVPIWLGLSRDMRMFEIAEELEDTYLDEKVIKPMNSSSAVVLPETSPTHIEYRYALGRGVGVMDNIRRRLEDGVLQIYHSEMTDDDIVYRGTSSCRSPERL